MFLFCLVFAMLCARLFICASWSPAGKGLTSWPSLVVSSVSLSLSHWYPWSGVVVDVSIPDLCNLTYFYNQVRLKLEIWIKILTLMFLKFRELTTIHQILLDLFGDDSCVRKAGTSTGIDSKSGLRLNEGSDVKL